MIDHIVLNVTDIGRSRAFYEAALAPLELEIVADYGEFLGFGRQDRPFFWIAQREPHHHGVHVAFAASRRAVVDDFHAGALSAGGRDNGSPGLRQQYSPDYYGAFVFDPDGNNIEAVCHTAED